MGKVRSLDFLGIHTSSFKSPSTKEREITQAHQKKLPKSKPFFPKEPVAGLAKLSPKPSSGDAWIMMLYLPPEKKNTNSEAEIERSKFTNTKRSSNAQVRKTRKWKKNPNVQSSLQAYLSFIYYDIRTKTSLLQNCTVVQLAHPWMSLSTLQEPSFLVAWVYGLPFFGRIKCSIYPFRLRIYIYMVKVVTFHNDNQASFPSRFFKLTHASSFPQL